ncbi:hypothetical protein AVEN_93485-1 [Araneus ventricosus]|uniref:Uncharacterized protein n=1 Tax=Araneus ventricosus TaxID=182803 RepID=A0A4Y2APL7_ARAVE|nr:hypothetical protein AVEN_93485-1 [Araneus ventricosus]
MSSEGYFTSSSWLRAARSRINRTTGKTDQNEHFHHFLLLPSETHHPGYYLLERLAFRNCYYEMSSKGYFRLSSWLRAADQGINEDSRKKDQETNISASFSFLPSEDTPSLEVLSFRTTGHSKETAH